jgi:hypothetical protein
MREIYEEIMTHVLRYEAYQMRQMSINIQVYLARNLTYTDVSYEIILLCKNT